MPTEARAPTSTSQETLEKITNRLDAIVRILLVNLPKEMNQTDRIRLLSACGMQPREIAEMIGTTPNTVSVALSKMRKGESDKKTKSTDTAKEGDQLAKEKVVADERSG